MRRADVHMSRFAILLTQCFATLPESGALMQSVEKRNKPEPGMESKQKKRLIVADFAASLLLALSIGVVTSIALGSAVLLLAQQSVASESASGEPQE